MRIIYAFVLVVIFVFNVNAQSVLFKEDFNYTTGSAFTYADENWELSAAAPVSSATASLKASGGNYLKTIPFSSTATKRLELSRAISKIGYTRIRVSWAERRTSPGNNGANHANDYPAKLYYSIDGGAYRLASNSPTTATADNVWRRIIVALPEADGANSIRLLWIFQTPAGNGNSSSNSNKDYYALDDFIVEGEMEEDMMLITPLPVELISFKGQLINGVAKLTWLTASEKNNDRFEVEHSADGKSFTKIGEVEGHGNSSSTSSYSFTDNAPVSETSYYRLRQVDLDGTTSFSSIIALTFANKQMASPATVYPTLASAEIHISLNTASGNANILVLDVAGKAVAQVVGTGASEITVPVQNLKRGVYFVNVVDGQQRETLRFVKQ